MTPERISKANELAKHRMRKYRMKKKEELVHPSKVKIKTRAEVEKYLKNKVEMKKYWVMKKRESRSRSKQKQMGTTEVSHTLTQDISKIPTNDIHVAHTVTTAVVKIPTRVTANISWTLPINLFIHRKL